MLQAPSRISIFGETARPELRDERRQQVVRQPVYGRVVGDARAVVAAVVPRGGSRLAVGHLDLLPCRRFAVLLARAPDGGGRSVAPRAQESAQAIREARTFRYRGRSGTDDRERPEGAVALVACLHQLVQRHGRERISCATMAVWSRRAGLGMVGLCGPSAGSGTTTSTTPQGRCSPAVIRPRPLAAIALSGVRHRMEVQPSGLMTL